MPLPAPRPNDVPRLLLAAAPSYRGLAERVAGGLADGDPAHHIAVFAEHVAESRRT
jgi:hypothetical protein